MARRKVAPRASFPDWVEPMAATLTDKRFTGPEWTFERKLDGIRLLAFKHGSDVRLLSRNQLPLDGSYPAVARAIGKLPVRDVILDGEATGAWGRQGDADYHVFDILWIDGRDVTALTLDERRTLLASIPLSIAGRARRSRSTTTKPWERACAEGLGRRDREAARLDLRAPAIAALAEDEVRGVAGARDRRLHRSAGARVGLGALLVGYFEKNDFVFAGKVGTGLDTKMLKDLRATLDAAEIAAPPFTKGTGLPRKGAHWVRPEIVVQVAFIEWTVHGKLRHPRLLGLRIDKAARDVVRERA